jgi:hypothetical protein
MDAMPSYSDAPFHCPPEIVLDLPAPISVNKLRKIDWAASKRMKDWKRSADNYVLAAKCRTENPLRPMKIPRFELWITLSEAMVDIDADNGLKHLIDYLRRIDLIENDAKKNMRGLHVVFGVAPIGCRVTVRPIA